MRFSTLDELKELCRKESVTIGRLMVIEQAQETGSSEDQIMEQMTSYYGVMKEAVRKGLEEDTTSRSGLTGGDAKRVMSFNSTAGIPALGESACTAMAYALAVSEVN